MPADCTITHIVVLAVKLDHPSFVDVSSKHPLVLLLSSIELLSLVDVVSATEAKPSLP